MKENFLSLIILFIFLGMIVLIAVKIFFGIKCRMWSLIFCYLGLCFIIMGIVLLIPGSWRTIGACLCFIGLVFFLAGAFSIVKRAGK